MNFANFSDFLLNVAAVVDSDATRADLYYEKTKIVLINQSKSIQSILDQKIHINMPKKWLKKSFEYFNLHG